MQAIWRAAIIAALLPFAALAQDVTLTSRDGALSIPGLLQGYDGEFFRIQSSYGLLTIDASGVICDGPACPDLTAPKAVIRLVGEADAGSALVPPLVRAFAKARGLIYAAPSTGDGPAILTDPATNKVLAEISFQPMSAPAAKAALREGRAELMVASITDPELGSKPLAMDALVPIVATDNPLPRISTVDLANALAGKIRNWKDIGGPDMPLVLHGLEPDSDLERALSARLGRSNSAAISHPDLKSLAEAVAKDPWALAVTGRAAAGPARTIALSDSCGFPLLPSPLAVKAEDYPLTLPLYLLTPRRRLSLMAREFLDFLSLPSAQAAIASGGFIDRSPERQPMTADGLRLINAIQGAGEETTLADLKRLVDLMDGADRMSLTFRFQDGSDVMDAASQENLTDLARMIEAGLFRNTELVLAGFSDGSGGATANLTLSQSRADAVLTALRLASPATPESAMPRVAAFGEALPMACDKTAAGRRLNRRVELWLKPDFRPRN
jgi:phosphate transport system substrate-binding protein